MRDLTSRLLRSELGEAAIADVDVRDDGAAGLVPLEAIHPELVPARLWRRPIVLVPEMPRAAVEHGLDAAPHVAGFAASPPLGPETFVEVVVPEECVALDRDAAAESELAPSI